MNCKKYINLLPLYVTGDLDKAELDDVKAHLKLCENCREELKQVSEIASMLTSTESSGMTELEKLKLENEIYRKLAKEKILTDSENKSSITINLLRVAAALIIFFIGFSVKSIITEPKAVKDYNDAQVMLTSLEKTGNQRLVSSGLRFSEAGFKLIANGKSSVKSDMNNN